jgi:hypothetical protein
MNEYDNDFYVLSWMVVTCMRLKLHGEDVLHTEDVKKALHRCTISWRSA